MKNFATRIKQLRTELPGNVGQLDLAKALSARFPEVMGKMSDRTISDWEGDKSPPRWGHALLLAQFFDVSLDYLAGWSDERGHAPTTDEASGAPSAPRTPRSDLSDEVASAGDARRRDPRPTPKRPGSKRRSAS